MERSIRVEAAWPLIIISIHSHLETYCARYVRGIIRYSCWRCCFVPKFEQEKLVV
jgi:hypothetical protein